MCVVLKFYVVQALIFNFVIIKSFKNSFKLYLMDINFQIFGEVGAWRV